MSSSARVAAERCNRGLVDWSLEAKREVERAVAGNHLAAFAPSAVGDRAGLLCWLRQ
jgi:hypothetical protein